MKNNASAINTLGNTTLNVGQLGFGCAPLGNLYQTISNQQAKNTLEAAWNSGIRLFDTAPHYGQGLSERRLGDLLRQKQDQGYVLSTKVGRLLRPAGYRAQRHGFHSPMPFDSHYDYSYDGIMRSFEHSLQRLGLDRIDVLLIHDLGQATHGADHQQHFHTCMTSGYKALDALRRDGRIKAIGMGVNEYQVCEAAMAHGEFDCFLLAGRYTLLEQGALTSFLPKCVERNSAVIIGGPFNSGILASGTQTNAAPYYNYQPAPAEVIQSVERIEAVCRHYQVPLPAAALQFPLAHPAVRSVIPGMCSAEQIQQSIDLLRYTIPDEFWAELKSCGAIGESAPVPGEKLRCG